MIYETRPRDSGLEEWFISSFLIGNFLLLKRDSGFCYLLGFCYRAVAAFDEILECIMGVIDQKRKLPQHIH